MTVTSAGTTWRELLATATAALGDGQSARWLLEEVAGTDAAGLLGRLDRAVDRVDADRLAALVARRAAGEPLQHVIGHWPFAGVELRVDRRALVPRPETEVLVAEALTELEGLASGSPPLVVDLGTGTGAIACALVSAHPRVRVLAVERDDAARSLAAENRSALTAEMQERLVVLAGSWFEPLGEEIAGRVHLVVANPPYLAASEWPRLDPVVREYDPYDALVAGTSGLEAVTAVLSGAPAVLARPGAVLCEIAPHQAVEASARARAAGAAEVGVIADLAGRERILRARW